MNFNLPHKLWKLNIKTLVGFTWPAIRKAAKRSKKNIYLDVKKKMLTLLFFRKTRIAENDNKC
ncbi:hypothetical protein BpHYR1_002961 [Brachionus plicatilis]|uniref:Uncharacterized protein n=1 Tax=Brachionus plicatilis TaxID=10195 RepID=A0A3M7SH41_BRAPC|nr:hypothetical protein BpHYR1_002961 [Brachionus plicatilis]